MPGNCYAAKQTRRFSGDVRLNKGSGQLRKDENGLYVLDSPFRNPATGRVTPHPVGFEPVMHKYRLPMPAQKKKPAKIFVCSMADLFGAWVPDNWIKEVFSACEAAPWHAYLFLTKNPRRYKGDPIWYYSRHKMQKNWWFGASITGNEPQDGKGGIWDTLIGLAYCKNSFLSIEPLLNKV